MSEQEHVGGAMDEGDAAHPAATGVGGTGEDHGQAGASGAEGSQQWGSEAVYGPSTVIAALDQLEDLIDQARSVPLSASVMVNRAELLDLIDQAREALPDDLVAADAVVADADAVLGRADSAAEVTIAEANTRARSTLDDARERADQMLQDAREQASHTVTRAQEEAEETRNQARSDAESTIADANAQAERLVSTENITHLAEDRARQIVAEAKSTDAQLRRGADEYAAKTLSEVAHLLADLQRRTDAGRRAIADRNGIDQTDIDIDHD
ncbi:DivIVA domain-containing protein [Actinomyces provencensis]|uniref:DivIVA domain-containing protein n=1 Tax=Actinomyces provencensis TaxID=1720198 RepID=UPI001E5EF162|nr:hypothetical protein [Actinomyces provencensis]